jgi:putative molybdopterin biosynthesis protein
MLDLFPHWRMGDTDLDARLVPLLRQVAKTGSLNRSVAALRMSYRHAWGLLLAAEETLGAPLVDRHRGRGARLTPFAVQLLAADDAAANAIRRDLKTVLQSLNRTANKAPAPVAGRPLIVHASHDLALAELRDMLAAAGTGRMDLHFHGSLDSLAGLMRRECEIAGFHLPEGALDEDTLSPYRPWLAARELRLIRFVRRRQGLMVAPGNPAGLRTVADIARKGARIVNRQPESGTRLSFDRLLAAARLDPAQIPGYQNEEFTHAAVAATVASGMADVGFGIEAAARRHGLDFVPLLVERYFLAARAGVLRRTEARELLAALKGTSFAFRIRSLPGYEPDRIGEIISVPDLLRGA